MSNSLYEVTKDFKVRFSYEIDTNLVYFKAKETMILKKGYVLYCGGTSSGGNYGHDSFHIILSLEGPQDFNRKNIFVPPNELFRNRYFAPIGFPELRIPFKYLPMYLNDFRLEKEILSWRLEKGV